MEALMRRIALAVVALALLGFIPAEASAAGYDDLLAPESACPGQEDLGLSPAAQAQVMVCMHNWARAQSGAAPLQMTKKLRASSRAKAKDIRRCKQFSHTACHRDAFYWFNRFRYFHGRSGAGENLAMGSNSAGDVRSMMSAWLNSPVHRGVLLDSKFTQVGISDLIAKFRGYRSMHIWVAHFGYRG
jgi:uncharacterized protein YkwD